MRVLHNGSALASQAKSVGSIPITRSSSREGEQSLWEDNMQVLRNGNAPAFQAGHVGSIPITCSKLPADP